MDMKKGIVCLSIIAIVALSILNVASVSANTHTTNTHSSSAMDVPIKERPKLVLLLSNNVTTVNTAINIYGQLATVTNGRINGVEGATVKIQRMNPDETWYTASTVTTMSGKFSGCFSVSMTPKDPGIYICRATYDGDNTYAPAISDMVVLTVH